MVADDVNIAEVFQPMIDATTTDFARMVNTDLVPAAPSLALYIVFGVIMVVIIALIVRFFLGFLFPGKFSTRLM